MTTAAVSAAPNTQTQSTQPAPTDPLASKDVFLQLLVAQLKNQDPESPTDGTQFVAQLAQFSSLEQETSTHSDLDAIKDTLATIAANTAPTSTTKPPATTNS